MPHPSSTSQVSSRNLARILHRVGYGSGAIGVYKGRMIARPHSGGLFGLLPFLMLLLSLSVMHPHVARAADNEEGAGFFQYFPAVPEIKLPKIDIIPFWTDDLKAARKAYNNANYSKALKLFRRASDDGNAVADWYLANMFRIGQGVPQDPAIAYSYYGRVSETFDPDEPDQTRLRIGVDSQLHLADYQRVGIPAAGLQPNAAQAARAYLRIASTYGHPGAHFALGVMNITGEGVTKNPAQGLKWLTAAARKRHCEAEAYLGDLYWNGQYVKKSETRALMWYTLAMETARPAEHAGVINRYQQLRSQVDEDTRLEAEARARVWSEQYPAALALGQ